jgi:hypothetical protein
MARLAWGASEYERALCHFRPDRQHGRRGEAPEPDARDVGEKIKIYPGTVSKEQYWELMPEAAGQALKAFAVTIKSGSS